eukprot:6196456-Pleurochrysis_carterae.AAC.2
MHACAAWSCGAVLHSPSHARDISVQTVLPLLYVFARAGTHARSAVGTNSLPFNVPVEIEMIAEVSD